VMGDGLSAISFWSMLVLAVSPSSRQAVFEDSL
jgi:hypothetical protein